MHRFSLAFLAITIVGCSTALPHQKATSDVSPIVLETDEALVGGPLTTSDWQDAFDRNEETLRECALDEPRPLGEMTLRMLVGKSGDVRQTTSAPIDKGVYTPEIFECFARATDDWEFPESGADSEIIVRLKFSRATRLSNRETQWGILGKRADASGHVLAIDGHHLRPDRLCESRRGKALDCGDVSLEFYRTRVDSPRELIVTAAQKRNISADPKSIEKATRKPVVCSVEGEPVSCYLIEERESERRSILFGRSNGDEFHGAFCDVPKDSVGCLGLVDFEVLE